MSHSYAQNHIHLVFSTKGRLRLIPEELQHSLWAYIAGICKHQNILAFAIGGMPDHLHILFRLPPALTLVRAVALIKSNSSRWIREHGIKFAWQEGYGAFAVSSSNVPTVVQYIDNQEAHHGKFTYEQEFIAMLKKQNIAFDPRHVFG
jgi:putative transposase